MNFDQKRERCWIAEIDGEPVGCVFLVKQTKTRGEAAPADRRAAGARPSAWAGAWWRSASRSRAPRATASSCCGRSPTSPRRAHIYKATGFKLVSTQRHQDFGIKLTGEYWELAL